MIVIIAGTRPEIIKLAPVIWELRERGVDHRFLFTGQHWEELMADAFFSELISLALPLQPLCSEDCRGLCPRCGADRNRVECDCEELKPPSPFAVLARLRDGGSGGEL